MSAKTAKRTMVIADDEIHYYLDGQRVSETIYRAAEWHTKPPDYEKGECPGMHPDYADFSGDVDHKRKVAGRRYYPQFARYPGDKKAFFAHKNDAIEASKKKGWVIDDG